MLDTSVESVSVKVWIRERGRNRDDTETNCVVGELYDSIPFLFD